MKTKITIILLGAVLLFANPVHAKECTQKEAFAAEVLTAYLDSWQEVYNAFKDFGHCDDAAIAEGFDEVITILWAKHWNTLSKMITYTKGNKEFKEFIYRRIGTETIPYDRWERIIKKAKYQCPEIAREFCKEIIKTENGKRESKFNN